MGMAKAAFNMEKTLFTSKLEINLRKKLVKCYIWNTVSVWCWKLGRFGKEIRNTWKVLNVVLEKDGEDQLDRSCENEVITESRKRRLSYIQ
jgi:hypothetical protein